MKNINNKKKIQNKNYLIKEKKYIWKKNTCKIEYIINNIYNKKFKQIGNYTKKTIQTKNHIKKEKKIYKKKI